MAPSCQVSILGDSSSLDIEYHSNLGLRMTFLISWQTYASLQKDEGLTVTFSIV